jgi:hypothetical protein
MDLINALPGNSSVNMNRGSNRRGIVFHMQSTPSKKHGDIGSLLPGNAAANTHPQEWEMVFSVGCVGRSYLKGELSYQFSSEFSAEDSHGKFVVEVE